jgi:hypothetical protein
MMPLIHRHFNSPLQLFMAMLWSFHELLILFLYWNLPAIHLQEQLERVENDERTHRSASESQPNDAAGTAAADGAEMNQTLVFVDEEQIYARAPCLVFSTPSSVLLDTPVPVTASSGLAIRRIGSRRRDSVRSR